MRRIVNSTYVSLDGVIENPQDWPPGAVSDDRSLTVQTELLFACDAVLMGRRTYEGFAPVWQTRSGDPYSDRINEMPKYVVSTTLQNPGWSNTTVLDHDPVGAIRELKATPGKDIVQYGFGALSHTLLEHDLIDELRLWIHPFIVGRGGPEDLLYRDNKLTEFTLADTLPLKSGVVVLTYHRDHV
jgi:dihydrofolate reductase